MSYHFGKRVSIVTDGLIWHIDPTNTASYPGSGSTIYDLVGSNDGTFEGGVYVDASRHLILDGVNDAINFGTIGTTHDLSLTDNFTIIGWGYSNDAGESFQQIWEQRPSSLNNNRATLNRYNVQDRAIFAFYDNATQYQTPRGTSNEYDNSVPAFTWKMMTGIVDSDNNKVAVYVNDTHSGEVSFTGSVQNVTRYLRVGSRGGSVSSNEWNGKIGAVMHYNRVLSATEIAQNYNATKGKYGL